MKANLSKRLIWWIGVPAVVLFAGVVLLGALRSYQRLLEQTETLAHTLAHLHAATMERRLAAAEKIPQNLGVVLERETFKDPAGLEGLLQHVVQENEEIYGSCVAFEPNTFLPNERYYAPYFYRKAGEATFVQLGNPTYDPFRWDWYKLPKQAGRALWSEPYFDDGGGETVMITYSEPFRKPDGTFWGIATIDIAMAQLTQEVEAMPVGRTGYSLLLSKEGRLLAYPDRDKIMRVKLQEVNGELATRMLRGEEGFLRTASPLDGKPAWVSFMPVQGGEFSLAVVFPEAEVVAQAVELQGELATLGAVGLAVLFVALVIVARSISRPVTALARAAERVAAGELDSEVRVDSGTAEVQSLGLAFRKMTKDLKMRMEELRYTTMVKERIEGELSAARTIQMSLVAKRFPAFPERPEVDIHALIRPARAVGGDFYDFFFTDDDCLCLVVADVAGKGVPAALFMAVCKTLLRAKAALTDSPAEMMSRANRELCQESGDSGLFVTLAFVLLNVRTGEVQLCNAGHPAPLRQQAGRVEPLPSVAGVALGAWPQAQYTVVRSQLAPGEALCFYTDGVTEAADTEGHFYTLGRLNWMLTEAGEGTAQQLTRAIAQDVRTFTGKAEQTDDLTLLILRWHGPAASAKVPASPDS